MDEPLYPHFLHRTGLDHPGRNEIVAAGPIELQAAVRRCEFPVLEPDHTVSYQKQMAHHLLPDMPLEWIAKATNFLLIRHPHRVLASYTKVRSDPTLHDLGFPQLLDLQRRFGPLPVIDADHFLEDPEPELRAMCESSGIGFDSKMLTWPPGPRPTDGVWSRYWYSTVEASTCFSPSPPDDAAQIEIADRLKPVAQDALEFYQILLEGAAGRRS
jgi:hypothetical protein